MIESIREEFHKSKIDPLILIICVIMPICINLLLGWEFRDGVIDHIPMAVVDQDNTMLSREFVEYFNSNSTFDLKYYVGGEAELKELLDTSEVKVGIVIPKNFSQDVTSLKSPGITMLYDGSAMNITSVAKAKASEILLTLRTGATMKQLEARLNMTEEEAYHTAMPINFVSRTLYNPAKNFQYFMLPGYGTIVCQTGIGLVAGVCISHSEDERKKKKCLGYVSGKICFYGLLGSIALIFNIIMQIGVFKIPYRGALGMGVLLSILLALAVAALAVAISAWFRNKVLAMAIVGLLLIPNSVMAGYTWPVISMVPLYQKVADIIPFYHYGNNIRNLFLKGNLKNPIQDIVFLLVFTVILGLIAMAGIVIEPYVRQKGVFKK